MKVHVAGIPKAAVEVMYKLIAYSENVTKSAFNSVPRQDFLRLAGLPENTPYPDIVAIMSNCGRAVASSKKYESAKPRQKLVSYASWPVFRGIAVSSEEIFFDVNPLIWKGSED